MNHSAAWTEGGWRLLYKVAATLLVALMLFVIFRHGITYTIQSFSREEYSHGYIIPLISAFLAWRNRHGLLSTRWQGSWSGVLIVLLGLLLYAIGEMGTIYSIVRFAFIIVLIGCTLAVVGGAAMRYLWVPLLYLFFMIPLPAFLYQTLSSFLQGVSSQIGVMFIRMLGMSVFLEGNIIDLGVYKLEVAEACSGLRYLFPLMSFGFLCAYLYNGPLWAKVAVFLFTIPATIFLNSFRIAVTGVLVNLIGIEAAEGFLHDFEGWVIFLAGVGLLFLVMLLLARLRGERGRLSQLIVFDPRPPVPQNAGPVAQRTAPVRALPSSLVAVVLLLMPATMMTVMIREREHVIPERETFATFPLSFDGWVGRRETLEAVYLPALGLDDYLLADFHRAGGPAVNLYVAFYESQREGGASHSPGGCLPAGGWAVDEFGGTSLPDVRGPGIPLQVNRALVSKGDSRLLVYYWFQERDRNLTNEYVVKAMIFWDALTRRRTDGAMVRVVRAIGSNEDVADAERKLKEFTRSAYPLLAPHLPGPDPAARSST